LILEKIPRCRISTQIFGHNDMELHIRVLRVVSETIYNTMSTMGTAAGVTLRQCQMVV